MSDDYTPTTEEMRGNYVSNLFEGGGSDEARAEWDYERENGEQIFDRWLAAHDAEKRAEWETERVKVRHTFDSDNCVTNECDCALAEQGETEWEYRVVNKGYESESHETVELARREAGYEAGDAIERRRKAGPWLPVTNTESEGKA